MDLVVAHAEPDAKRAAQLAARLVDVGLNARLAVLAGGGRAGRNENPIGAVVLLWSRAAARARRPQTWGTAKGPPLFIARLDDAPRPAALRAAPWFTLVDWRSQDAHRGFQALRAALAAAGANGARPSTNGPNAPSKPETPQMTARTKGLWSLSFTMALVGIGLSYAAGLWTPGDLQALLPSRLISH